MAGPLLSRTAFLLTLHGVESRSFAKPVASNVRVSLLWLWAICMDTESCWRPQGLQAERIYVTCNSLKVKSRCCLKINRAMCCSGTSPRRSNWANLSLALLFVRKSIQHAPVFSADKNIMIRVDAVMCRKQQFPAIVLCSKKSPHLGQRRTTRRHTTLA